MTDPRDLNNILQMQGHVAKQTEDVPSLLSNGEKPVFEVINPKGTAPIVLVCEHASHTIPTYFDGLGLSKEDQISHIAWDPGAKDVAIALSKAFDAPLVCSRISRLVYDCNRPPESPTAIPGQSETTPIPGNQSLSSIESQARIEQIYVPFDTCLSHLIEQKQAGGIKPALVTIHSFTPVYFGKQRSVELGILHADDARLADGMLTASAKFPELQVERNQPYGPEDGVTHTLEIHGESNALPNVMIEIRNDLLTNPDAIARMAAMLKTMIGSSLSHIPSKTGGGVT